MADPEVGATEGRERKPVRRERPTSGASELALEWKAGECCCYAGCVSIKAAVRLTGERLTEGSKTLVKRENERAGAVT
jgi:hypothetical protein